jgi:hypothetical protein
MVSQAEGSRGRVGRKELSFNIKAEKFKDYPVWSVGKEIPLTVAEAVKIADSEIINYTAEKSLWYLSSIE